VIGRRPPQLGQAAHGRILVVAVQRLVGRPPAHGLGARLVGEPLAEVDRACLPGEAAHHLEDGRRQIGVDGVDQGSLLARTLRASQTHAMRIVDFEPRHAPAWKALNEAWIGKHFAIEPADAEVLGDPVGKVLAPGGHIFMAETETGEAIGCVGLKAMDDGGFEVIKMTVSEAARGTGLGRDLMQACIERARALGAPKLYLETNSSLAPALGLYRAMGFVDLPRQDTPYARCDVWMALALEPTKIRSSRRMPGPRSKGGRPANLS
jgi:putative acetyltransferase